MTRQVGLGFYPDPGVQGSTGIKLNGARNQTTRLEVYSTITPTLSNTTTSLGTRVVCHRIYKNFVNDIDNNGSRVSNMFAPNSNELYSFNSGHVLLISTGTAPTLSGVSWAQQVVNGKWDSNFTDFFRKWEALLWGNPVSAIGDGAGGFIPGSQYLGTKPSEGWYLFAHEPNVASSNHYPIGTPAEFSQACKHIMQLYDGLAFSTPHIKFAVCMSSNDTSSGGKYDQYMGRTGAGAANLGLSGVRPLDGVASDLYFPRPQIGDTSGGYTNNANGMQSFSSKFEQVRVWTRSNMPTDTPNLIGEYAIRFLTKPVSGPTPYAPGPDSTWPATWYGQLSTYLNTAGKKLSNGDHCLRYMCQYVSTTTNVEGGGTDNSIIPDQYTLGTGYEQGGVALRPAMIAFYDALIGFGNPSLTGANGVVPTGLASSAITSTGATLTWTTNAANVTYNVYKDTVKTQSGLTAGSATVSPTNGVSLPQTHGYTVTGVGTNGNETALSSNLNITFPVGGGSAPGTPTGLAVSSITANSAVASCTAGTGTITGYNWFLDGHTVADYTSTLPTVTMTGLVAGSGHTVKVLDFNANGASAQTGSVAFSVANGPDTTPPSVPTSVAVGTVTATSVPLSWGTSTDPTVSGQATSGLQNYYVYRSLTADLNSGIRIGSPLGTSFTDAAPASNPSSSTVNYYSISAIDNASMESAQTTPLAVTVPASGLPVGPTAVININPNTGVLAGQTVLFDAGQSYSGTGGTITSYAWAFGDGVVTNYVNSPSIGHVYQSSAFYTISLTVKDAANRTGTASATLSVAPQTGAVFPFTGSPLLVSKAPIFAANVNNIAFALDQAAASIDQRMTQAENSITETGFPTELAVRHGGALFASTSPGGVASGFTLSAGTGYVIRCATLNGQAFSQVNWAQTTSAVSTVTNSFWAVYDVAGKLMSASPATDCSAAWMAHAEGSYVIDGGPFDPPLGADDTDPSITPPTNEFFLYFYLGTVGGTKPAIGQGSTFALTVNMGCNNTITPTQATIQTCPLFATAANIPSVALTPPATLGTLTPLGNSLLITIY